MKLRRVLAPALVLVLALGGAHARAAGFDPATGAITDTRWQCGVPLGGIGVGKVEVMTDGSFGNFTNQDNWDRPYRWARGAFAAVRAQVAGAESVTRILRLTAPDEYHAVINVEHTRMQGWFPRAQVEFADTHLPVQVRLDAFSPLIPHDLKDSGLPVACLSYTLTNPNKQSVDASLLLAWPNVLGWGGRDPIIYVPDKQIWANFAGNTQAPAQAGALQGLRYTTTQSYPDQQRQNVVGEDFIGVRQETGLRISTCPSFDAAAATPAFWDEFSATGELRGAPASGNTASPAGAVAAALTLAPGESRTLHFYVVWAMPHLIAVRPVTVYGPTTIASHKDVGAMFDADSATRWTTGRPMQAGDNIVLDLGRNYTPTHITLDSGSSATDFPHGLLVETSVDAKRWQGVADLGIEALRGSLQGIPLTPLPGRYLRLTNQGADSTSFWSIYSLTLHVKEQTPPLDLTAAAATAHLKSTRHRGTVCEDMGHFWLNWWHSAAEIAAYTDQNADRLLAQTRAWQTPVLNSDLPFWLKLKLINCAFPVVTNSVLTRDGRFSQLECPIAMFGSLGTMDQRMAAHAFYTAFFPELDRTELELFASCQQADGRITHFAGNVHQVIGKPDVYYGITDWPDLSCAWVMQVAKLYRWTGDEAFLQRMLPHVSRAMAWLDQDGRYDDHIPTGGSTYDYQTLPQGAFIYTASCYLGALRAAAATAPDASGAKVYDDRLAQSQHSVMTNLWNGTFFRKWKQPSSGKTVEDSFVANLAGDWLARLAGLPRTLAPDILHRAIAQTIARHQKPFFPVPPMQVTPGGQSATHSCYLSQDEPYLGCEAIYENYVSDGLETLRRVYLCAWEINHSPWNQGLGYDAPSGWGGGASYYMTCPTSWFVLDALGGTSLDLPHGRLYISPRLAKGQTQLHIPVYFSRFWGWLDYVPAEHHLSLRVDRVYKPDQATEKLLFHAGPIGAAPPENLVITSVAADGDAEPISLPKTFLVQPGTTLDLSPCLDQLNPPKAGETVDFEVKAPTRPH